MGRRGKVLRSRGVEGARTQFFARLTMCFRAGSAVLSPIEADYLARICAAVGRHPTDATTPFSASVRVPVLVNGVAETLTGRELKVLRLLADGATNTHIGTTLFISVNTVRWHVANILSKLQVENRTQAAAAARELGLTT